MEHEEEYNCEECEGGWIKYWDYAYSGKLIRKKEKCEICDGTGRRSVLLWSSEDKEELKK